MFPVQLVQFQTPLKLNVLDLVSQQLSTVTPTKLLKHLEGAKTALQILYQIHWEHNVSHTPNLSLQAPQLPQPHQSTNVVQVKFFKQMVSAHHVHLAHMQMQQEQFAKTSTPRQLSTLSLVYHTLMLSETSYTTSIYQSPQPSQTYQIAKKMRLILGKRASALHVQMAPFQMHNRFNALSQIKNLQNSKKPSPEL